MKHKFKLLCAVAALGILATGCSKEGSDTVTPPVNNGEKGYISLTVSSEVPATRAADPGAQTATDAELKIDAAKGLKVYVFDENGVLNYSSATDTNATGGALPLTDMNTVDGTTYPVAGKTFRTTPFEVTAGDLYFFVFANDGTLISAPITSTPMEDFMKQAVATVYSGGAGVENTLLDIATDNQFLLGTLWREDKLAAGGGTLTDPKPVDLTIGRLSSKIHLSEITYATDNAELKGTFSAGKYRLGTLANKINTVGFHSGAYLPVGNDNNNKNVLVESKVHNSQAWLAGDVFNSTDFVQYTAFKAVNTSGSGGTNTNMFYATENTTARDASTGQQYFGNTSYIQVETVYTPKMSEVYNPADIAGGALGTDATDYAAGTFWTGIYQGKRLIFNANPNTNPDVTAVKEYTDGLNYHKFPVFDPNETDAVYKNRVLRNHYYDFNVTNFKDLGSHTKDVDPKEPIPDKTTVDVKVTVANWDKVKSGIEL